MFGNSLEGVPNVDFVQGDIRDYKALASAMQGVTDVVHLAGVVTDELVALNPARGWEINHKATEYLLAAAYRAGVKRFIYASSSSVYGSQDVVCTEDTEPKPMTSYAESKLAGEREVIAYADAMTVTALRMATLCGPAPRMRLDTIINIFSKQAYFDGVITVWDGSQWRSNLHVEDATDAYLLLLDAPAEKVNGQVFNLTSGNHTAFDLAVIVQLEASKWLEARLRERADDDYIERKIPSIERDESKRDGRHYRMDASKIQRVLGWEPQRTIEDAIRANFAHFAAGKIADPNDPIYRNTARMADFMKEGAKA